MKVGEMVKSKKAFVSFVEMIVVLVTLFIAFSIFFPGFSYRNRWTEALMKLKARDLIITADRSGMFFPCAFSAACLKNTFLDLIIPTNRTNIIPWTEIEGTVKSQISISCNCSTQNIEYLYSAFNSLTINGRDIAAKICYTDLESAVNPCMQSSDILVIWGYKDLSSTKYREVLRQYLQSYGGVLEITDFPSSYSLSGDYTQQQIFGISDYIGIGSPAYDLFIKPANASLITYQPYKFFHYLPLRLTAATAGVSTAGCAQNMTGNFTIRTKAYPFSVCNGATVYFDTNGDGRIDSQVSGTFKLLSIGEWLNFTLKSVSQQNIKVSFNQPYKFLDFAKTASTNNIISSDDNYDRVLLKTDFEAGPHKASAVVMNGTRQVQTVWMADFSRDVSKAGDDHKNLVLSLILALSNKKAFSVISPNVKTGFVTSYLGVAATDFYEIFRFNLGLGYPY